MYFFKKVNSVYWYCITKQNFKLKISDKAGFEKEATNFLSVFLLLYLKIITSVSFLCLLVNCQNHKCGDKIGRKRSPRIITTSNCVQQPHPEC